MLQFAGNEVHFTPLISYQVEIQIKFGTFLIIALNLKYMYFFQQTHKENAPDCLAITYYTELLDDKNLVLLRGEFDKNIIVSRKFE